MNHTSIGCMTLLALSLSAPGAGHAYWSVYDPNFCQSTPLMVQNGTLTHPEIVTVFWGTNWSQAPTNFEGSLLGEVQYLVNGPFFAQLGEYGPLGPARMSPIVLSDNSDYMTLDVAGVAGHVNSLIGAGTVPPPNQGTDMMYLVLFPNATQTQLGKTGRNWVAQCDSTCGSAYDGASYTIAAVYPQKSSFVYESYTSLISHELAEGMAAGTYFTCAGVTQPQQVTDVCSSGAPLSDGFDEKTYWSNKLGKCVRPDAYAGVVQYNGSPNSWTVLGGGPFRQVVAGKAGLYGMDENDNVFHYEGSNGWVSYGYPSGQSGLSTIAAGDGGVVALSTDSSTVYADSGTGWTSYGAPHNPVTSLASGFEDVVTAVSGDPWKHTSGTGWWKVGATPGDQFVVGSDYLAAISPAHDDVWLLPVGSSTWIDTFHRANELYIGGDQAVAARDFTGDLYGLTTTIVNGQYVSNGWNYDGSPGREFALWGDGTTSLAGLNPWGASIWEDPKPIEYTPAPAWIQIGNAAVRLIGHGSQLYAAYGLVI